jgi:hypothetical protein
MSYIVSEPPYLAVLWGAYCPIAICGFSQLLP